jgi:hypothetical protein
MEKQHDPKYLFVSFHQTRFGTGRAPSRPVSLPCEVRWAAIRSLCTDESGDLEKRRAKLRYIATGHARNAGWPFGRPVRS